jgi:hypothetical protein
MELITEGVAYDRKHHSYIINQKESPKDLISLRYSPIRNYEEVDGVHMFYGYKLDATSPENEEFKRRFLNDFKGGSGIPGETYYSILKNAVIGLNYNLNLAKIDVIVYPKSSSRVNQELAKFIQSKGGNAIVVPDSFIKNSIHDIEIDMGKVDRMSNGDDETKANILAALDRMFQRSQKSYGDEFKMKILYPNQRELIRNFMKFKSETGIRVMQNIEQGTVLFLDDIYTSGTTLREMVNILRNLGASHIFGFALFKV